MGEFTRKLNVLFKAGLNALLAPAEDPREAFGAVYERQRLLLEQVRRAREENARSRERLAARAAEVERHLAGQDGRARQALLAGRDDLKAHIEELQLEGRRLGVIEQRLVDQAESLQMRRDVIAARSSAAEAQVRVSEMIGGVARELHDLESALEQATQQAERLQARAAALGGPRQEARPEGQTLPGP